MGNCKARKSKETRLCVQRRFQPDPITCDADFPSQAGTMMSYMHCLVYVMGLVEFILSPENNLLLWLRSVEVEHVSDWLRGCEPFR